MSVQNFLNNDVRTFILAGMALVRDDQILLQDAGRGAVPLATFTLMAKVAATGKWVPFTDETAVDGTALPQGIFFGDPITGADIVAGDVADVSILEGEALFDVTRLIIENSKLLTTVIAAATVNARTVADQLAYRGLYAEDTVNIGGFENA